MTRQNASQTGRTFRLLLLERMQTQTGSYLESRPKPTAKLQTGALMPSSKKSGRKASRYGRCYQHWRTLTGALMDWSKWADGVRSGLAIGRLSGGGRSGDSL